MVVPFIARGTVFGALSFYCLASQCSFSDMHIDFGRKLSASLSLVLEDARLFAEVKAAYAFITDITDRRRREEEVRHMAHHDALTGLPNRRLFADILGLELAKARRSQGRFAVLFLDLDRFKYINDTLGHDIGDELLNMVAERLRGSVRESDIVSRMGGDEFNILLADIAHPEDIITVARKIIDSFREPFAVKKHTLHISTSIGISICPDDALDSESLL